MKVITISRFLNSGGLTIGQQVADELGYAFVTKETIEKIMNQYGMVEFDALYEHAPGVWDRLDRFQEDMVEFLQRVMYAMARRGNVVILGRGSFAAFHNFSDVLNVRLWATAEERAKRYMKRTNNTSWREAMDFVENHDKVRNAFVERWLHGHPDRANAFDLTINTSKVPADISVRMICDIARASRGLILEKHRTTEELEIDPILMKTVEDVLG